MPRIAVILCTRNPRPDYLERVLRALREQTLPRSQWEFCLVDSASDAPLSEVLGLLWHPSAQIVRVEQPGLTPARLAGFAATTADLIVLVDDDNVLAPDYLEQAVAIGEQYTWLGAWGGNVQLIFEEEPPVWLHRYRHLLAERKVYQIRWSNDYLHAPVPCGAGMVVRRQVAEAYRRATVEDPARQELDRSGDSLLSDGDTDLALMACDLGLGLGAFPMLGLQHLIPARRLTLDYIVELHAAMIASGLTLRALRPETEDELFAHEGTLPQLRRWAHWWRGSREDRIIQRTGHEARLDTLSRLYAQGLLDD
ncbi:MAG: glycosyl transferase family protein [Puniceicoccaceae bacterium 5H]|nr:MAG: glycosyl transferase family protein [Puniceicoccaceae bacterium 5H]